MCLGVPGQVLDLPEGAAPMALVDVVGVRRQVNIALIEPDGVKVGDWVLIHLGHAMAIIDEEHARADLDFLDQLREASINEIGTLTESMPIP